MSQNLPTQPNLFRLPAAKRIEVTPDQLRLLDFIGAYEGEALTLPVNKRAVLRRLVGKQLVAVIALGPARYKLTPVGRMVRGRKR